MNTKKEKKFIKYLIDEGFYGYIDYYMEHHKKLEIKTIYEVVVESMEVEWDDDEKLNVIEKLFDEYLKTKYGISI